MSSDINDVNHLGEAALIIAAPKGDIDEVRRLLVAGADPCYRDRYEMTARIRAQNNGHNEIVALLLEAEIKAGCAKQTENQSREKIELEAASASSGKSKFEVAGVSMPYRYSVYSHPTLGYETVKNGFSWPALFFTWIWAFIKKLWGLGIGFIVVIGVLVIIESVFRKEGSSGGVWIMLLLQLGVVLLFGFIGNRWLAESMEHRGFSLIARSLAETPYAAISEISKRGEKQQQSKKDVPGIGQILDGGTLETNTPTEQEATSEYALYEQIADELESGEMDRALWTKALAMSEGEVEKQKAIYIKLRISHLINAQSKP